MNFKTKPKGMWANFETSCAHCAGVLTISNGRPDPHTCERITGTLAELYAALDNRQEQA